MALVLPSGIDLREAVSRACETVKLIGLNAGSNGWAANNFATVVADWHINPAYVLKEPEYINRAPTEAETQTAANTIAAERQTTDANKTQDATEKTNAQTALSALTTIKDSSGTLTGANISSALRVITRVLIWIIKRQQ